MGERRITVIDDSDGVRPAYRVAARCFNCNWAGEVRRKKGFRPQYFYQCPRCGCQEVRPSNEWRGEEAA